MQKKVTGLASKISLIQLRKHSRITIAIQHLFLNAITKSNLVNTRAIDKLLEIENQKLQSSISTIKIVISFITKQPPTLLLNQSETNSSTTRSTIFENLQHVYI
ncbi:hypothetical protein ACTFIV_000399 [Dictyostelium citrinum]